MRTLVMMLMGGLAAVGGYQIFNSGFRVGGVAKAQAPAAGVAPSGPAGDLTTLSDRFEVVAKTVLPAVVSIEAVKAVTPTTPTGSRTAEDSGTGILIQNFDGSGFAVITNNHVVAGARPENVKVNMADGRLIRPSAVIGDVETDIAVLRVSGTNLPTAKFGDSDRVRVGQWVLALGSPYGLSQSVTHGIISARDRGRINLNKSMRVKDFLQTDAAINPGSSGGPLVNLSGEVVGVNTAIASESGSSAGVTLSIPSNLVRRIAKQLLERGVVSHGYLGLALNPSFDPSAAEALGLDRAKGAKIDAVVRGSPGERAGLKQNDVVLHVDSVPIRNDNHLINLISMLPAGQKVRLEVWRDRKSISVDAEVADWQSQKPKSELVPKP
ncbi:MAG: trypsin-like peptidase domain-containing protein [Gemmataceae bacterium]|nr:trypsin-like peptidase domain-containing protein [Gemmataceae bacterium]